jgi:hypothetical protein
VTALSNAVQKVPFVPAFVTGTPRYIPGQHSWW